MEQKYYVASKGSWPLSVTHHPGELTERDIVNNLARMMRLDTENQEQETSQRALQAEANQFYQENVERLLEMVKPGVSLQEMPQEELEETLSLPFSEWEQSEFPRTEWD